MTITSLTTIAEIMTTASIVMFHRLYRIMIYYTQMASFEEIAFLLMPKAQSFANSRVYAVDTFGDELRETLSPLDYNE